MASLKDQERNREIATHPDTPSPYPPQEGICGHCGSADVDAQFHESLCRSCGKYSELDGRPIDGVPFHQANVAVSMPWVNDYLKSMKR